MVHSFHKATFHPVPMPCGIISTYILVTPTYTYSRGDARLSIFVAHHLAPLARTYSAHRPSRNKENQR